MGRGWGQASRQAGLVSVLSAEEAVGGVRVGVERLRFGFGSSPVGCCVERRFSGGRSERM